jgi:nicotinamidase-related amidase
MSPLDPAMTALVLVDLQKGIVNGARAAELHEFALKNIFPKIARVMRCEAISLAKSS